MYDKNGNKLNIGDFVLLVDGDGISVDLKDDTRLLNIPMKIIKQVDNCIDVAIPDYISPSDVGRGDRIIGCFPYRFLKIFDEK